MIKAPSTVTPRQDVRIELEGKGLSSDLFWFNCLKFDFVIYSRLICTQLFTIYLFADHNIYLYIKGRVGQWSDYQQSIQQRIFWTVKAASVEIQCSSKWTLLTWVACSLAEKTASTCSRYPNGSNPVKSTRDLTVFLYNWLSITE